MRQPPSVSFPVGRVREARIALAAAWFAAVATHLAWWWEMPDAVPAQVVGALLLVTCAALAWRSVRRDPSGVLEWDGRSWHWVTPAAAHAAQPQVTCDLQGLLIVRLGACGAGAPRWLWLRPGADRAHWRALRRALHFEAPPAGERAPASPVQARP